MRAHLVPWSIVRATQFDDLMEVLLGGFSRLPGVMAIPFRWRFQPVDARDVAGRVVDVVLSQPTGIREDLGGPEVRDFKSIAESWPAARKQDRRLVNLWLAFKFDRQVREGCFNTPDHEDGTIIFDEYLNERYPLS